MPGDIPSVAFRLKHGFAMKPELVIDEGPGAGLLMGQNSPKSDFDAIYIGKGAEPPYKPVWLDVRGAHVLYVMGKRRSGKSYTLGVLAEGLAAQGWVRQGCFSQGVLVLDTMNVFLTMPFGVEQTNSETSESVRDLRRSKLISEDIPIVTFCPRGTQVPRGVNSQEISLRPSDLGSDEWCGLFEVDPFADPLGHLVTELYARVASDGYVNRLTQKTIPRNPAFTLQDLLEALDRDQELDRYHKDTKGALRRRLDAIRRLPIFSNNGLDVRQLCRPNQVSILLLRDLSSQMRSVLVALIIKRVMQLRGISEQEERMIPIHLSLAEKYSSADAEAASRERQLAQDCRDRALEGLPRSWIIIDEAHNYIPAKGQVASSRPLKKYVDEGRNLGLSLVVATQQPSGIDPSIQRNADMLIVHSLSHRDDIRAAEGMINADCPEEVTIGSKQKIYGARTFEMVIRNLPQGYALASTDRANRLFPLFVRPRITVHGGTDY
jgi:hypothetical protein